MNKKVQRLKPSATVMVMDRAKKLRNAGVDIIDLGGGEPDFDSPIQSVLFASESLNTGDTHYVDSRGLLKLRERIAKKLKQENHIIKDPVDEIIVTPGGKFGLFLAMFTFLNQGDEVLLLDPSWVSYESLAILSGATVVKVPLSFEDNYRITETTFDDYISEKTKMIIVNTPNNPSGRVLRKDEIDIVAEVVKKHNLLLVSDEIYGRIVYDEYQHISLGSVESIKDQVITINGFSKNYAMTGWRLGYVAASKEKTQAMLKVHQHTITCVNSFAQKGGIVAFDCEDDVKSMLKIYENKRNYLVNALNKIPGITCPNPEGAFYVMPKIQYKHMDSVTLAGFILEEGGVAVTPGSAFGQSAEGCVRLSFATSMANLQEAVSRLKILFGSEV